MVLPFLLSLYKVQLLIGNWNAGTFHNETFYLTQQCENENNLIGSQKSSLLKEVKTSIYHVCQCKQYERELS